MLVIRCGDQARLSGTGLFRQERIGRFGRVFLMFKFRSMRADAHLSRHRRTRPIQE